MYTTVTLLFVTSVMQFLFVYNFLEVLHRVFVCSLFLILIQKAIQLLVSQYSYLCYRYLEREKAKEKARENYNRSMETERPFYNKNFQEKLEDARVIVSQLRESVQQITEENEAIVGERPRKHAMKELM